MVFQGKLNNRGIPNVVYYPSPLQRQTAYKKYPNVSAKLATKEHPN
jgi:dTDP-4-amino-4,6-dideoxygalactose transaminase